MHLLGVDRSLVGGCFLESAARPVLHKPRFITGQSAWTTCSFHVKNRFALLPWALGVSSAGPVVTLVILILSFFVHFMANAQNMLRAGCDM